jgi:hypothetical protein
MLKGSKKMALALPGPRSRSRMPYSAPTFLNWEQKILSNPEREAPSTCEPTKARVVAENQPTSLKREVEMKAKSSEVELRAKTPAEFRRMCDDHNLQCLIGHPACEADRVLQESADAVKELAQWIGDNDRDLIASHYAIMAAHIARGLR